MGLSAQQKIVKQNKLIRNIISVLQVWEHMQCSMQNS